MPDRAREVAIELIDAISNIKHVPPLKDIADEEVHTLKYLVVIIHQTAVEKESKNMIPPSPLPTQAPHTVQVNRAAKPVAPTTTLTHIPLASRMVTGTSSSNVATPVKEKDMYIIPGNSPRVMTPGKIYEENISPTPKQTTPQAKTPHVIPTKELMWDRTQ